MPASISHRDLWPTFGYLVHIIAKRGVVLAVFRTTLLVYHSDIYPQGMTSKYGLGGRLWVTVRWLPLQFTSSDAPGNHLSPHVVAACGLFTFCCDVTLPPPLRCARQILDGEQHVKLVAPLSEGERRVVSWCRKVPERAGLIRKADKWTILVIFQSGGSRCYDATHVRECISNFHA